MSRFAAAVTALAVMAAIAGTTVSAFAGSTSNAGNTFAAAASFCTSPGTVTASANADSWIDEESPNSNFGNDQTLRIRRQNQNRVRRSLVRFTLPAIPARCSITAATLRLYAGSEPNGQTVQARRVSAAWTEAGVTWSNQPASASQVTTSSAPGWNRWSVTAQVQTMYTAANNGFLIRFATEGNPLAQIDLHSRGSSSQRPELLITFG